MIRFSKIFFILPLAVLLVWQLPWCYAFLTLKPVKTPLLCIVPYLVILLLHN